MLLTAFIDSHSAEADDSDGSPRSRIDRLLNDVHPFPFCGCALAEPCCIIQAVSCNTGSKRVATRTETFLFTAQQSASACRNLAHLQACTRSPGAVSLRGVPGGGEWSLPGQGLYTSDTGTSKEKEDMCVYIYIFINM